MIRPCETCPLDATIQACEPTERDWDEWADTRQARTASFVGRCMQLRKNMDERTGFDTEQAMYAKIAKRFNRSVLRRGELVPTNSGKNVSPVLMVFGDADGFGELNKRYGHEAGDFALGAIANAIRDVTRESDARARRSDAADEFIIGIFGFTGEQAYTKMREIRRRLRAGGMVADTGDRWTATVVGAYMEHPQSIQDVKWAATCADHTVGQWKLGDRQEEPELMLVTFNQLPPQLMPSQPMQADR